MKKILVSAILILGFLTGCIRRESVFLSDDSCNEPCWSELKLGQSKNEVLELLNNMKNIDQETYKWTISNDNSFDESVSWKFINMREKSGSIAFKNNQSVAFGLTYPKNLVLGEIISKIGEPGKVFVHNSTGAFQAFNKAFTDVSIIFPQHGICSSKFANIDIDDKYYLIDSNESIQILDIVDPNNDPNQLINGCLRGLSKEELAELEEWVGYGNYSVVQTK